MNYICRIELEDINPTIWRKFSFHPEITFHQLHQTIQEVMGWTNSHLYEFDINNRKIEDPNGALDDFENEDGLNARKEKVSKHLKAANTVFTYMYDFGDGWSHRIKLEEIDEQSDEPVPVCLEGERACPLEDVGGPWGHQNLLAILADKGHAEYEEMLAWAGEDYDPEHFDSAEVNRTLRSLAKALSPKLPRAKAASGKKIKLTKPALTKHLKSLDKEALIELVKECFGASKDMERFLTVKIMGEEAVDSLFEEYSQVIEKEFFPSRGEPKLRLQVVKKAIAEFEKLTGGAQRAAELRLVYVEQGVEFVNHYNYFDERFFGSIASVYADVVKAVLADDSEELLNELQERLYAVVTNSRGSYDWFHDDMQEIYSWLG